MQQGLVGNAAVHETGSDAASVRQIDKALVRAFQDAAEGENLQVPNDAVTADVAAAGQLGQVGIHVGP